MSTVIHAAVERELDAAFAALGLGAIPARLVPCPASEMGDAAIQAALPAARILRKPPIAIAADIASAIEGIAGVASAEVAHPGYVNLRFDDRAIAAALMAEAGRICPVDTPERMILDFGGPNLGKALHVGHLRSFVIGESLRRMLIAVGHDVISDAHLGDWGLPCGQIVCEIRRRHPGAPWFEDGTEGPFPKELPVPDQDLDVLYPAASAACKADAGLLAEARIMTAAIQAGDPGPAALWALFASRAKLAVRRACGRLGVGYDLFLGEADAQAAVPQTLAMFEDAGVVRHDGAALLVDLAETTDRKPMPPLVLSRGDGSALYATTDLATILQRARDPKLARVLYVVDARQHLHFEQVFRAAGKAGLASGVAFEHLGFGTVDGPDGKPLRTRDGGVMRLDDLLDEAVEKARAVAADKPGVDARATAEAVGMAALKIADLSGNRTNGYVLDLDRALAFEGHTGPYLLYALVRLRTLLAKVEAGPGPVVLGHAAERRLALAVLGFGPAVHRAAAGRAPHELVAYGFPLAAELSRFYVECPVGSEPDDAVKASRIAICRATEGVLARVIDLLGCEVPAAM
ncbi:arginine--tRNA ligase [Methylobacterium sp. 092160098-2]|uniref:arginine--tRNA ligase n=1 Tax=Methylobacterium sp. 092160098-2 TaxID=3025129 RepID=UPI002381C6FB|nr:arginine--tRNA ligase [Methylobacterium sp. 092160098-2]MDE4914852.1 arginine--tRNA ligase [Methylobacterium sp. 092160098-2]